MLVENDKTVLVTQDNNWATLNRLMSTINQKAFYGTAVGFQCVKSMKPIVNVLVSSLVGYSKFHYSDKHKSIRLLDFNFSTSKYFLKPKHRGHKFVASSEKGDIEFCKVGSIILIRLTETMTFGNQYNSYPSGTTFNPSDTK